MMLKRHVANAVFLIVVTACAVMLGTPIANADDPNQDCAATAPANEGQPCEPKQQGPGMPEPPKNSNNNSSPQQPQSPQQEPQPTPQQQPKQQGIDLADKNCWVVKGVPTMWSPGLSTGPGEQAWPCYYVYGLKPH